MAQITTLTPLCLPGKNYSFSAKDPAVALVNTYLFVGNLQVNKFIDTGNLEVGQFVSIGNLEVNQFLDVGGRDLT